MDPNHGGADPLTVPTETEDVYDTRLVGKLQMPTYMLLGLESQ